MSELQVNTIRPVSGTTLTVTNNTNLTVSGTGKVTTPVVEAADLDINGTSSLELKFNNATKLAVTNTGATVTGTMAATAFSGDGSGLTGITSAGTGGTSSSGNLQLISNSGGANGARDIIFLDQNSEKARLYGATGDFAVDTDTLYVQASNDRVGIGTTSPTSTLDVDGTCTATAFVGPITGNVTGTIQTAAQPNITSTGALTVPSISVTGNITGSTVGALAASLLPSGSILQVVQTQTDSSTDYTLWTTWGYVNGMSVTITPKRANSRIFLIASFQNYLSPQSSSSTWVSARFARNQTTLTEYGVVHFVSPSSHMQQILVMDSEVSPGTTSQTYYLQLQIPRASNNTTYAPNVAHVGWATATSYTNTVKPRHMMLAIEVAV